MILIIGKVNAISLAYIFNSHQTALNRIKFTLVSGFENIYSTKTNFQTVSNNCKIYTATVSLPPAKKKD